MRPGEHLALRAAAGLYLPLCALFALSLFVSRAPGSGVGVIVGFAFALVLVLHVLVYGAQAARRALPGFAARPMLTLGLIAALAPAVLPPSTLAARVGEAGLFVASIGAWGLAVAVLAGRAPTLRDEDW